MYEEFIEEAAELLNLAVWRDSDNGGLAVLPPCGRCRLFISQMHPGNRETLVVLGVDEAMTIDQLVPRLDWPEALPARFSRPPMIT